MVNIKDEDRRKNTIYSDDLVQEITDDLNKQGMTVKYRTIKMIVDSYLDKKYDNLTKSVDVDEGKIGITTLYYRKVRNFSGFSVPKFYFKIIENDSMIKDLIYNIVTLKQVRDRMHRPMESDDITYLRKKHKIRD